MKFYFCPLRTHKKEVADKEEKSDKHHKLRA
jgi:hypothetical protein